MSTAEARGRRARLRWVRAARTTCAASAAGEECGQFLISGADVNMLWQVVSWNPLAMTESVFYYFNLYFLFL